MARPEIILGIDLGNSFSTAAAWVNGRVHLVPDNRGEPCIPSVVYFPEQGSAVVGSYAVKMRSPEPANTISGVKRILGSRWDSAEVRIMNANSAVGLHEGPNSSVILKTRRGKHTPTEVASLIYKHLRELAEARFGSRVNHAMITIPAATTKETEAATIRAAEMAGLQVIGTLAEPHAGAVAYQIDQFRGKRSLLVYDFGGGTFDVTVLDQHDSEFHTRSINGDRCLGGDDFDNALAQAAAAAIWKEHGIDVTKDLERWDRVLRESEVVKRALSARSSAPLRLKSAFTRNGRTHDLDLTVLRSEIEPRWHPLVQRSIQVAADSLVAAGLRPKNLDLVLLVGGTTYVPLVQHIVEKVLGKKGRVEGDPQTAVACGAALMGARLLSRAA